MNSFDTLKEVMKKAQEYDLSKKSDHKYWGGMLEKMVKESTDQVNFGKDLASSFKNEDDDSIDEKKAISIVENILKGINGCLPEGCAYHVSKKEKK